MFCFLVSDILHDGQLDQPCGAALQWCLNFSEHEMLQLVLMALPVPASSLEGKPAFRRDACPGIFIHKWDVYTKPARSSNPRNAPLPILFVETPSKAKRILGFNSIAFRRIEDGKPMNSSTLTKEPYITKL
jgi:hypothetical protein